MNEVFEKICQSQWLPKDNLYINNLAKKVCSRVWDTIHCWWDCCLVETMFKIDQNVQMIKKFQK